LAAKNPLPAVISLLNWRSTVPESAPPPDLYWGLLVQGLIDSGQIEWASRLMRDPAAHFSSAATPSTFLLEIAEWDYAHGDLDAAQKALDELKGSTPSNSSTLWQDLQSRLLLSEGKYDEAFSLLSVGKQNDPAQSAFGVSDTLYPFMRYNLGVALINMGRVDEGRTILDRLGKIPAKTDELRALRDKANLTLGWQLLKSKQGETALTVLGRVSIDGPFSNRALLGSGWAKLIGAGANQSLKFTDLDGSRANQLPSNVVASLTRNGLIDCEDANHYYGYAMQPCVGHRIGRSKLPLEKEALLKRALVPWIELSQRNPYDQAVQESWVAIPFALQQIEAFEQAATYYDLAIQRFESLRAEYAAAISAAKANSLLPAPNLGANAPSTGPGSRFDKEHIATLAFLLQVIPENVWNSPLQD
jgi:tetratricopeptide (TPR) repeat protein